MSRPRLDGPANPLTLHRRFLRLAEDHYLHDIEAAADVLDRVADERAERVRYRHKVREPLADHIWRHGKNWQPRIAYAAVLAFHERTWPMSKPPWYLIERFDEVQSHRAVSLRCRAAARRLREIAGRARVRGEAA